MWKWIVAGAALLAGCVAAYLNQYMWHYHFVEWLKVHLFQPLGIGW